MQLTLTTVLTTLAFTSYLPLALALPIPMLALNTRQLPKLPVGDLKLLDTVMPNSGIADSVARLQGDVAKQAGKVTPS